MAKTTKVRIRNKLYTQHDLDCPEDGCGSKLVLRPSRYGVFYGCPKYPECPGACSAHKDTGKPMGYPADGPTKKARMRAHRYFDRLWKEEGFSRGEAYDWIQKTMDLTADEAHIAKFDIAKCEELVDHLKECFPFLFETTGGFFSDGAPVPTDDEYPW